MHRQALTKIAILAATLAAVLPGAAFAAPISTARTGVSGGLTGTPPVTVTVANRITKVQGYSTGEPGAADDETCAGFAGQVNEALDNSNGAFKMGDDKEGMKWEGIAQGIQDYGMDNGCFFINPV